jgi:hypothetical protein
MADRSGVLGGLVSVGSAADKGRYVKYVGYRVLAGFGTDAIRVPLVGDDPEEDLLWGWQTLDGQICPSVFRQQSTGPCRELGS